MDISLENKTALVCGSTQGIGKAAAIEMAGLGATVICMARNEEKLKNTVAALPTPNGQVHQYIAADFSEPKTVQEGIEHFLKQGGQVDILVNNTGGPPAGPISDATLDAFYAAFNLHLINNHQLATAVLPGMKERKFGRIINVISTSVKIPLAGLGVSNTIRGAVGNWSKTLANEVGSFNITVNNVLPGATSTERLTGIINNKMAKTGKSEAEIVEEMTSEVPMKRFAKPEEVANAVVFLASPAASYINGINIPVDGGRTGSL
ncbi:MAG: SDR family oxidoreductase [Schleiferiaceae bacterium]